MASIVRGGRRRGDKGEKKRDEGPAPARGVLLYHFNIPRERRAYYIPCMGLRIKLWPPSFGTLFLYFNSIVGKIERVTEKYFEQKF